MRGIHLFLLCPNTVKETPAVPLWHMIRCRRCWNFIVIFNSWNIFQPRPTSNLHPGCFFPALLLSLLYKRSWPQVNFPLLELFSLFFYPNVACGKGDRWIANPVASLIVFKWKQTFFEKKESHFHFQTIWKKALLVLLSCLNVFS